MERFADELQAAMAGAGLTASQLAQRSGLTESAISLLRSGRREPTYRTVRALAAVLPALAGRDAERVLMDSIESAVAAIRDGQMVIVLDDEDRENEGDLVMAAEKVTPEAINFMRKEAGGLICVPMTSERLDALQIPNMVNDNTAPWAPRSPCRSKRAAASPPASRRTIARTRSRRSSTRIAGPPTSCGRGIPFRCARGRAACSCARGRPKRRSISRSLRGSIPPASSARSWTTTGR